MQDKEEKEMVGSELLRMLEDVANREIPCQVAYRDIQKRLTAAHEEGFAACKEEGIEGLQVTFKETLAKAHAEGVAEGAEGGVRKERRRLKATRERYVEGVRFINDVGYYLIPLRAFRVPPASVLAPTKEKS